MKKLTGTVIVCLLAFGVYYAYKHKNRFIYRFSESKTEVKDQNLSLEVEQLKKRLAEERALSDGLNEKLILQNDTIYSLRQQLKRVSQPSDQPSVKVIKTTQNPLSLVNNKSTNKNEKNLPIARGRDAVELKEFFTDRYDHR